VPGVLEFQTGTTGGSGTTTHTQVTRLTITEAASTFTTPVIANSLILDVANQDMTLSRSGTNTLAITGASTASITVGASSTTFVNPGAGIKFTEGGSESFEIVHGINQTNIRQAASQKLEIGQSDALIVLSSAGTAEYIYMVSDMVKVAQDRVFGFGGGDSFDVRFGMGWSTLGTDHAHFGNWQGHNVFGPRSSNNYTGGFTDVNYGHTETDGTTFFHSDTLSTTATDEWISIKHDTTDGVIATGSGDLVLTPASGALAITGGAILTVNVSNSAIVTFSHNSANGFFQFLDSGGSGFKFQESLGEITRVSSSNPISLGSAAAGLTYSSSTMNYVKDTVRLSVGSFQDATRVWNPQATGAHHLFMNIYSGHTVFGSTTATSRYQSFEHTETDNTVFFHSPTIAGTAKDEWLSIKHDTTDGQIVTGSGDLVLAPASGVVEVIGTNATGINIRNGADVDALKLYHTGSAAVVEAALGSLTLKGWGSVTLVNANDIFIMSNGASDKLTFLTNPAYGAIFQNAGKYLRLGATTGAYLWLQDTPDIATFYGDGVLLPRLVEANTDTGTFPRDIISTESWKIFTNEGATGENHYDLLPASSGLTYTFIIQNANGIQVNADTGDTIRIAGSVSATGGLIAAATVGNTVTLVAINSTEWFAIESHGTWTVT
jgi:hypothetical protein